MIKAVLDTNVWVSGLFWRGNPYNILQAAFSKKFVSITSKEILNEVAEKLLKKFDFPENETKEFIEYIILMSVLVDSKIKHFVVKDDSDDDKIIDCAVEGNADFIVSGDKDLLKIKEFKGIKIFSPKQFAELI